MRMATALYESKEYYPHLLSVFFVQQNAVVIVAFSIIFYYNEAHNAHNATTLLLKGTFTSQSGRDFYKNGLLISR